MPSHRGSHLKILQKIILAKAISIILTFPRPKGRGYNFNFQDLIAPCLSTGEICYAITLGFSQNIAKNPRCIHTGDLI